jgi:tRNA (guanine6-N2)-methyltransferase
MYRYAGTCIAGTQEIIIKQLKEKPLDEAHVRSVEDGLIIFDSVWPPEQVTAARYWSNVFLVVWESPRASILEIERADLAPLPKELFQSLRWRTVQLRFLVYNKPEPLPIRVQKRLEDMLHSQYRLLVNQGRATAECWVNMRQSGYGFIGLRLPRPRFKRDDRPAGKLRPELAHLLCLVAGITKHDIVLDPFAGYGAIPLECIAGFSPKRVIAVDQDKALAKQLGLEARTRPSLEVRAGNGLELPWVLPGSVKRIVTDPPWGQFKEGQKDMITFYSQMLRSFHRVLQPGGVAVVLTGAKDMFESSLSGGNFELIKSYDILVSGRPAKIYKLRHHTVAQ